MLMIRLARRGKKNKPFYRIVVSEKARDMFGRALEIVGHYDPLSKEKEAVLEADRILYWMKNGAQPSPTVRNLLIKKNIITGEKIKKKSAKKKKEAAS